MDQEFELKIVTPKGIFYEGNAAMVELETSEGEMGIYPSHEPMTAVLCPGMLRIHAGGRLKVARMQEGFLQILSDSVTILPDDAVWQEDADR